MILCTLGDNRACSGADALADVLQRLTLADQRDPDGVNGGSQGCWISERQHQGFRLSLESQINEIPLARNRPGDETAADGRNASFLKLLLEPGAIAITAADHAQRSGLADRCSQAPS